MTKQVIRRPMPSTKFQRHIDVPVDNEGDRPDERTIEHCRMSLGPKAVETWIDVRDCGFDKDWMWVMGVL